MAATLNVLEAPLPRAMRPREDKVVLTPGLETRGLVLGFQRDEAIFNEEDAATSVCKVVSGVVRTCRIMNDGRRHIVAFYFPGDIFGLEGGASRAFDAEAVTECRIALIKRADAADEMDRADFSRRDLWRVLTAELQRVQEHSFLLSRLSAVERVWSFLKGMAERQPDEAVIDLPMSRTDIADHLGLTIETVSRAFTHLRRQGVIDILCARRIAIRHGHARAVAA